MKKTITIILLFCSVSIFAEVINITPENSKKHGIKVFQSIDIHRKKEKNDLLLITFIFPKQVDNFKFSKTEAVFWNKKIRKPDIQVNLASRLNDKDQTFGSSICLTKDKSNICSLAIHYKKGEKNLIYHLKLKLFSSIPLATKKEKINSEPMHVSDVAFAPPDNAGTFKGKEPKKILQNH